MARQLVHKIHDIREIQGQGPSCKVHGPTVRSALQDYVNIMEFLMKHWNIAGLEGLNSPAQKAQEDVQALLTKFRRLTDRQVGCPPAEHAQHAKHASPLQRRMRCSCGSA